MLSTVLNSERAIEVNIEMMRLCATARDVLSNAELSRRLGALESKYDSQFKIVFDARRKLMSSSVRHYKEIGFRSQSVKK
jgi:hypothetical protein